MASSIRPFSDLLDFLAETDIFYGLPSEQLAAIAQIARSQSYDKREALFLQGDEGNGFYIVQTGRVKVFQLSASGREQILHVFSAGDHFAEVPAFDGKAFPASAEALEPTTVLFFPRQLFLALLEQNPTLAINMLKSAARHLRRFSHLIDDLSLKEVPGRLAAHLLKLSEQADQADQVELNLSKRQLASLLGTIPETLSRVLYRLHTEGIIGVEGTRIQRVDRDALQDMAQ
jgi:CRP/FNR family transcriptional regulator